MDSKHDAYNILSCAIEDELFESFAGGDAASCVDDMAFLCVKRNYIFSDGRANETVHAT